MTCEAIYQMAGQYLASCRDARDAKTLTRETTTVKPPDGTSGGNAAMGTATEKLQQTEKPGGTLPDTADVTMLGGVILDLSALADEYSRQKGQLTGRFIPREIKNIRSPFPLPDRFAPAAAFYLASLLCLPLDREMADLLRERGDGVRESIRRELVGVISGTRDVYAFF